MRVLILGVTGMLGNAFYRYFSQQNNYVVFGTLRNKSDLAYFPSKSHSNLITGVDVLREDAILEVFKVASPDVVINCVGLIKQFKNSEDPLVALPINSMLPHRLSSLCEISGARLIHFSTDCVFSGQKGMYKERDDSDAKDLYGKSKYIGEVVEARHAVTLRTSIIGHELNSAHSLIDWFCAQSGSVKGYRRAVFSGLPTIEIARVVDKYVMCSPELYGLFHLSAEPINKMSLLQLVSSEYGKDINIIPDDKVKVDRSLDSERFRLVTGYIPPSWHDLVKIMHDSYVSMHAESERD